MSEKNPENSSRGNPDKERLPQPLTDDCSKCERKYKITNANGRLYQFEKQPECNYVQCNCTNCNNKAIIFIDEVTFNRGVETGLFIVPQDYPSEYIYNSWLELQGITLAPTYELTNRHEALIQKFGEVITNMPPELFWDNIDGETGRPYTERWT